MFLFNYNIFKIVRQGKLLIRSWKNKLKFKLIPEHRMNRFLVSKSCHLTFMSLKVIIILCHAKPASFFYNFIDGIYHLWISHIRALQFTNSQKESFSLSELKLQFIERPRPLYMLAISMITEMIMSSTRNWLVSLGCFNLR